MFHLLNFSFQPQTPSEEVISTPFNVTHLLHVNPDNVEEFMAKLAESKTGSTTARPKILKSRPKSKGKSNSENAFVDRDKQAEEKQRNAPKPPARPVSCFVKVNSEQNLRKTGPPELYSSGLSLEQDIPPRPKPRPISMPLATSRDAPEVQPFKEQSRASSENVDGATVNSFEAPKLPPRRPPRFTPAPVDQSDNCDEFAAKNLHEEDMYSTIDETARLPVKPRNSTKLTNDGQIRPPLPPRKLLVDSSCRDDETCSTIPSTNECPSSPDLSCQDAVNTFVTKSETTRSPDIEVLSEDVTGFSLEATDSGSTEDNYLAAENDAATPDPIDVASLYGVVNKPRSTRQPLEREIDQNEIRTTPLPGESAPPLPPRTKESFIKKGPPLPPRPNIE